MTEAFSSAPSGKPDPFSAPPAAPPADPNAVEERPGQRRMPHPITGRMTWFTRASGWGGSIADETILNEWKIAFAVMGVAKNEDLYALANSEPMPEETMELRDKGWWMPWAAIGHMAMDRAGDKIGAHLGTAFHAWREQFEAGKITMKDIPEKWRPHMRAFLRIHKASGIAYRESHVERLVVTLDLHNGVCGRLDNIRELHTGQMIVDDTKTGKSAPTGIDEIAVQLAIYANAPYHYAPTDPNAVHGYIPAPENIRKDVATITWIPINNPDAAEIIPIDIAEGWEAAKSVEWQRRYVNKCKRKNDGMRFPLSYITTGIRPEEMGPVSIFDVASRIAACTTLDELGSVVLQAATDDRWTPRIERLAIARKAAIKAGNK
jgi:hypothetical protein